MGDLSRAVAPSLPNAVLLENRSDQLTGNYEDRMLVTRTHRRGQADDRIASTEDGRARQTFPGDRVGSEQGKSHGGFLALDHGAVGGFGLKPTFIV